MCTADAGVMFATKMVSSMIASKETARAGAVNHANQTKAMKADVNAIALRSEQSLEASQQKLGERALDAQRELGRINSIVADSGMSGGSVDRLRSEVTFNAGKDISTIQVNAGNALKQSRAEIAATGIKYENAADKIKKPPTALQTGLTLFGEYLDDKDGATFGDIFGSTSTKKKDPTTNVIYHDPRAGMRGGM